MVVSFSEHPRDVFANSPSHHPTPSLPPPPHAARPEPLPQSPPSPPSALLSSSPPPPSPSLLSAAATSPPCLRWCSAQRNPVALSLPLLPTASFSLQDPARVGAIDANSMEEKGRRGGGEGRGGPRWQRSSLA
jgi:hypothetical protein